VKTNVADLMTTEVVSVDETAGFKQMVELIEQHRISALPVVDGQRRVIGVVSEADLILKEDRIDLGEQHVFESHRRRQERERAGGTTARELASVPAVTIGPGDSVREAAKLMHDRAIKRLPVVDGDGRLVGVISRSDVLRVFMRSDDEIRREIVEDVIRRTMLLDAPTLVISVTDGIVTATGEVDRKTDAEILTRLSAAVAGVVAVESHIRYRYDDEKQRGRPGVWSGRA
jgi:CBS-domain-containing membrane protein